MNIFHRVLSVAVLAASIASAPAYAGVVIGAPGDAGTGNCYPFGCAANSTPFDPSNDWGTEYQQVYAASDFSGPITITSISFFHHNADGTISGNNLNTGTYIITLALTSKAVNGLDTSTLANNFTNPPATQQVVFTGTLPADVVFGGQLDFILSSSFFFDPAGGYNLLLDIVSSGAAHSGDNTYLDAIMPDPNSPPLNPLFSRAMNGDGSTDFENWGLVTGFNDVPEPGSLVLFASALLGVGFLRRRSSTGDVHARS